ncbi:hypothetical protein GcM1_188032 [Golovinomyces cichoracearum]|uniref:Tc1-like transposase DDE domain-containing protein n=1 Tax=Golovinomyces cichoracearum TaxID=62708 RepID=A0A420J2J1_9PEZI|nr:hypothetical protein GcM1_188032 [Golovinomyces cichoracearum]
MRRQGIHLIIKLDSPLGQVAADTKTERRERRIVVIFWLPIPPDFNPIERVWHIMNYLEHNYLEIVSYNQLREAVKDAWEKVVKQEFRVLIEGMLERCLAVEKAEARFTKY